jgi:hypothetical protein
MERLTFCDSIIGVKSPSREVTFDRRDNASKDSSFGAAAVGRPSAALVGTRYVCSFCARVLACKMAADSIQNPFTTAASKWTEEIFCEVWPCIKRQGCDEYPNNPWRRGQMQDPEFPRQIVKRVQKDLERSYRAVKRMGGEMSNRTRTENMIVLFSELAMLQETLYKDIGEPAHFKEDVVAAEPVEVTVWQSLTLVLLFDRPRMHVRFLVRTFTEDTG